jgi:predicted RNase H-like HicB family nuclease
MEMYTYPITVEREGREYWAYSEDFPGVYGLGNSIEEAKASILESMRLYIEECRASHRPIPRALHRKESVAFPAETQGSI